MTYRYQKALTGVANLKRLWTETTGLTEEPTTLDIEVEDGIAEVVATLPKVEGSLHFNIKRVPLDGVIKEDIVLRSVDVRLDDGLLNKEDVLRAVSDRTGVNIGEDDGFNVLATPDGHVLAASDHSSFFVGAVPIGYIPSMADRINDTNLLDWRNGDINVVLPETILLNTSVALDATQCDCPEDSGWTVNGQVNRVSRGKSPNRETYFNTPKGTIQARTRVANDGYVEFDIRVPGSAKPAPDLTRGVYVKLHESAAALFQVQGHGLSMVGSEDVVYEHDFTDRTRLGFGYDRTLKVLLLYINGQCVAEVTATKDTLPVGTTIVGSFTEREQHFYVYGISTGDKLPTGFPVLNEGYQYAMLSPAYDFHDMCHWSKPLDGTHDYCYVSNNTDRDIVDGLGYGDYWFELNVDVVNGEMGFSVGDALRKQFNFIICSEVISVNHKTFRYNSHLPVRIKGRYLNALGVMELLINDVLVTSSVTPVDGNLRNRMAFEKIDGEQHIYGLTVGALSKRTEA